MLAPAKVNLALEVLGPREDGFHELRTVFQSVGIYDELRAEASHGLHLVVDGDAPAGNDNLVLRAARSLSQPRGEQGARLRLTKRIPTGAGLGGGSSDAAVTLVALNALWRLGLARSELERLGRRLGADVPFFLHGGAALGGGRGDEIRALPAASKLWLVLATPPFHLRAKTARIFQELRPEEYTDGSRAQALAEKLSAGRVPADDDLYNGLLAPACRAFEELAAYAHHLHRVSSRRWTLSGAGPTFYCLTAAEREAQEVAIALRGRPGQVGMAPATGPSLEWIRPRGLPQRRA